MFSAETFKPNSDSIYACICLYVGLGGSFSFFSSFVSTSRYIWASTFFRVKRHTVSIVIVCGFLFYAGIGLLGEGLEIPGILLMLAPMLIPGVQIISRSVKTKKQVARQIETMESYIQQMKDQANQIRQEKY